MKFPVSVTLQKRIARANAKGSGYVISKTYNSSWRNAAEALVEKGKATVTKSRGKSNGLWLKNQPAPKATPKRKLAVRKPAETPATTEAPAVA